MNKLLTFLTVLFFIPFTLLAQNKTITGKVIDESGNPVQGVNILAKGSKNGVQSDKDGNFSITVTVTASADLVVSAVGYATKIVSVSGTGPVSVQLVREAITQEDVVVIGYQTVKRRDL
ncbi:MAG TPA: carboxypeptidase-like regulatory domain-containing protein, partial [Ferruginibacter sp.]|nr:carboxypeptidase-like regulatory domain-containing protein [Ferruginibacter sp.]